MGDKMLQKMVKNGVEYKIPAPDKYWLLIRQTAPLHIYVSPAGADDNDGLSETQPLKTIQRAVNLICDNYFLMGCDATIHLAAGTYEEDVVGYDFINRGGRILICGAGAATTSFVSFSNGSTGTYILRHLTVKTKALTFAGVYQSGAGSVILEDMTVDGRTVVAQNLAQGFSLLTVGAGNIDIYANVLLTGAAHGAGMPSMATDAMFITGKGLIRQFSSMTINLTGACRTTILAIDGGYFWRHSVVADMAISGIVADAYRYIVNDGVINTWGKGANYFPGSKAGYVTGTGVYK